jgi:UDP-N-acetylglucosamine acyltransferase
VSIHPLACVDSRACLASDVSIGPWSSIGPEVTIDSGTSIAAHVVIAGKTHIGKNNRIQSFVSLGGQPQHLQDTGEGTALIIGDHNHFFEQVTVSRGTQKTGKTTIGSHCMLMVGAHVAHDCVLEDKVTLVNHATMAGHVHVQKGATLGAFSLIHQHCMIGAYSFLSRACAVPLDVMPYVIVVNNPAEVRGINKVGLRRAGYSQAVIKMVEEAFKLLFRNQSYCHDQVLGQLQVMAENCITLAPMVALLTNTKRGFTR